MNAKIEHEIRASVITDRDAIVETLVTAFTTDPLEQSLFPDPTECREQHRDLFSSIINKSESQLVVDVTATLDGCAIWYPPEVDPDFSPPPSSRQEVVDFFHSIEASAPSGERFWYLAFIGARSKYGGIGSALLKSRLAQIKGLVAFWTGNEANIEFYRRFGFQVFSHCEVNGLNSWWLTKRLLS